MTGFSEGLLCSLAQTGLIAISSISFWMEIIGKWAGDGSYRFEVTCKISVVTSS
jgi:hypothetical protein